MKFLLPLLLISVGIVVYDLIRLEPDAEVAVISPDIESLNADRPVMEDSEPPDAHSSEVITLPQRPVPLSHQLFLKGRTLVRSGDEKSAWDAFKLGYEAQIEDNQNSNGFKDFEVSYSHVEALAWRDVGKEFVQLKQHSKAIQAYQNAIAIEPAGRFYLDLAAVYESEQQIEKATESFLSAGNMMLPLHGDLRVDAYRAAIRLNPNIPEAHNGLGESLVNEGKIKEATLSFEKALELNPSLIEAQQNLNKLPVQNSSS